MAVRVKGGYLVVLVFYRLTLVSALLVVLGLMLLLPTTTDASSETWSLKQNLTKTLTLGFAVAPSSITADLSPNKELLVIIDTDTAHCYLRGTDGVIHSSPSPSASTSVVPILFYAYQWLWNPSSSLSILYVISSNGTHWVISTVKASPDCQLTLINTLTLPSIYDGGSNYSANYVSRSIDRLIVSPNGRNLYATVTKGGNQNVLLSYAINTDGILRYLGGWVEIPNCYFTGLFVGSNPSQYYLMQSCVEPVFVVYLLNTTVPQNGDLSGVTFSTVGGGSSHFEGQFLRHNRRQIASAPINTPSKYWMVEIDLTTAQAQYPTTISTSVDAQGKRNLFVIHQQ